jgi:glucose/arabinose dehydrogenase
VVLSELFMPTGLVWRERELYLMALRDVLRASLGADGRLGSPEQVLHGQSFNTRSEGQIDLLPDGRLLFEISGDLSDDARAGRLFALTPGGQPELLASGLKNAYAHAIDPASGQVFTTDIGDDAMDGQEPPEEIDLTQPSTDYGWPHCYSDRVPAVDRGGTPAICGGTAPPLLTFPPHTTPTGLLFYDGADFPPEYREVLYVALWNGMPPQVQRVTIERTANPPKGSATPFVVGIKHPIDLVRDPSGGMLVLDYEAGVVYRIVAEG